MDGTTGRVRARRQTRTSTSIAGDEDEYAEPPVATVKRTTRRTSVITVEPKGENGHAENASIHDEQQDEVWGQLSRRFRIFVGGCHGYVTPFGQAFRGKYVFHVAITLLFEHMVRAACVTRLCIAVKST